MSRELTLDELIGKLLGARLLSETMYETKSGTGTVRFRFAVKWSDYGTSPVSELDPFGPIVGVTTTLDGTTIVDVVAELAEHRQTIFPE